MSVHGSGSSNSAWRILELGIFGLAIGLSKIVQEACNKPHVTLRPHVSISPEDQVFKQIIPTCSAAPTLALAAAVTVSSSVVAPRRPPTVVAAGSPAVSATSSPAAANARARRMAAPWALPSEFQTAKRLGRGHCCRNGNRICVVLGLARIGYPGCSAAWTAHVIPHAPSLVP